jgi:hypothetical protein
MGVRWSIQFFGYFIPPLGDWLVSGRFLLTSALSLRV